METEFVDRVEPMEELRSLVRALGEGRGGALLVEGASGMGKTSLLGNFVRRAAEDADAAGRCRLVLARCHPGIGPGLLYGPVIDILHELHTPPPPPGIFRRMLGGAARGAGSSVPELLSSLVPGLGAVFTIGREVTEAALNSGSMPSDSLLPFQQGLAAQIVDALLSLATAGPPVVLVIDDVQHIDASSLLVLDRLLRLLPGAPIGLVLSHASDEAQDAAGDSAEELLRRWESESLIRSYALDGLPEDAVAELVRGRYPDAPPGLPAALSRLTAGYPVFVQLCLDEWLPEDGERLALPESVERVVEHRMRRLGAEDQALLEAAATQGPVFLSRPAAETVGASHEDVTARLRRIAKDHRLIVRAEPADWAAREPSDAYAFPHQALWQVLYRRQTPQQRRMRHARIARSLADEAFAPGGGHELGRRLEIARHLEEGGPECLADAARAHYALARSAAIDGLSFAEAERHCEKAIQAARALPGAAPGRDALLVRAIELLLSLTEVRWRGQHTGGGGPGIDALAAEAEGAAARLGEPHLLARTTLLRGKTLMATQGLLPGLDKLRAAVEIAGQQDDPVALFVAKVEYGRQASKRDLAEGTRQLEEAEELYASEPRLGGGQDPVLQHARNLNEMQLGIGHYDMGRLGQALNRLVRCVERLRTEPLNAELPIALNYLAQVRMGVGQYGQAEAALVEARAHEAERGGESGWHAYNTALLARCAVRDPERRGEALTLAEDAWLETEATWLINLVPIVRNLYAEVLLETASHGTGTGGPGSRAPGSSAADRTAAGALDHALRLATDTVVETRRTGMVRSEIAALSLSARVHLVRGELGPAAEFARRSVELLRRTGDMPALRSEEVLLHAARALHAAGPGSASPEEVAELLGEARAKVMAKADSLADPALRHSFLTEVALNRAVVNGRLEDD
ncbi:AAA family ATPase [Streptomyces sp. SPB074]|uniref:AAA family ATPase n=1 Tax=Streptomyces sp. (strain SPB074) TaxID=465543 RepID=UPI00017F22DB|nr:AAA family ATPase [Streptomyces sp. SPB074]